jgi:hydrogenase maturation factor
MEEHRKNNIIMPRKKETHRMSIELTTSLFQKPTRLQSETDSAFYVACSSEARMATVGAKTMDQYGLVHVGLYAIRSIEPKTWTASFDAMNLDPTRTHRDFPTWCKEIMSSLQTGQEFKVESDVDTYALLPSFWHGMTLADKMICVSIINRHDGFTVACVNELMTEASIPLKDLQNLCLCYEMTKQHPSHLEMGTPSFSQVCP